MGEFFKKFIIIILYTLIVIGLYLFITTNGTLKVILSEYSNINLVYFCLFIFIYVIGVIFIILIDMSKSSEKKDLKKLKLRIPNKEEYDKLFHGDYFIFRTPLFNEYDQRHYISDSKGNVLYKIKLVKTLPHVFKIYDSFDNELGKVECDIFDNLTNKLIVELNNKKFNIEKKISTKDFLHSEWILTNLPYKITYKNNKTIVKEKTKEIAFIESYKKSIEESLFNYDMNIKSKDKVLEISIITLSLILGNPVYKRMMLEGE